MTKTLVTGIQRSSISQPKQYKCEENEYVEYINNAKSLILTEKKRPVSFRPLGRQKRRVCLHSASSYSPASTGEQGKGRSLKKIEKDVSVTPGETHNGLITLLFLASSAAGEPSDSSCRKAPSIRAGKTTSIAIKLILLSHGWIEIVFQSQHNCHISVSTGFAAYAHPGSTAAKSSLSRTSIVVC